jgi:Flp pilus assembly protein TadG
MTTFRRFFARDEEEGQAVVLFAILMLALLFMIGLAIDAGQLYANKRFEQEAADAAAFAGAVILYQGGTGAQAIAAAKADATTNGYTTDDCTFVSGKTCVTVNWPPASGLYSGRNDHVEVIIKRQVQTSLVPAEAAFNPVTARGVAGAENINSGYAIMALDRGPTCSAFNTGPQGDLHLNGGGILVNSSCATAATNSQGTPSRFTIQNPYGLDVNGNATGSWAADGIPVVAGHNQMPDPFANFPTPLVGVLPTCNSLAACQDVLGNQNPGIYTVNLGGAGGTNMTLNPGTYILKAGMDTSGNANVNGTGILIYNTYTTYPNNPGPTPSCGQVKLAGNAVSTLSAQTTGTWKNLLVYQDAKCTTGVSIVGNGTFNGTGSFYVPSAPFSFSGQNATLTGSQLIANTVDVQNGNITINYSPSTTAQPILPRLAE